MDNRRNLGRRCFVRIGNGAESEVSEKVYEGYLIKYTTHKLGECLGSSFHAHESDDGVSIRGRVEYVPLELVQQNAASVPQAVQA